MGVLIRNKLFLIALAVLVVVLLCAGGFLFYKKHQTSSSTLTLGNKPQSSQDQVAALVAEVGKLMELPQGEDPTVATITDINKLKDQPLFAKGANGDKVLIYSNAKKAILYDPVGKRIVDVETINIGSSSATEAAPSSSPAVVNAKVVVLNGTTVVGLAGKTATAITQKFPQVTILSKGNAQGSSYSTTQVVSLTDTGKAQVSTIASGLGVSPQAALPSGETAPAGADIVVIVGSDLAK